MPAMRWCARAWIPLHLRPMAPARAAPSPAAERRKDLRAGDLLDLLGLRRMGDLYVCELSTGTRRIAELGCLVALGADVLLLDEPTAGIAQREVEMFRPVLREIRDHL